MGEMKKGSKQGLEVEKTKRGREEETRERDKER